ncbi:unnamed protein product, partial [Mesorhabditis belari]|uniref:Uncharacterized protein n=1 Tax=Mesorhabditis belari TaxID=2138241 RepID=A0AAF3F0T3_9BILA
MEDAVNAEKFITMVITLVYGDNTCLPNEKCIEGKCKSKLWPGEYGCESDEECSSRCPNTYCEKRKSDKNVAQCQYKDGMLLYGRCYKMECCLRTANKQVAAFVAALLSFIAQVLSALIIQDTGYFFGIITFSLCCHALLFHGIRKQKMSFMIPYLVCQIVCAAYVLGETFNYARGLSDDEGVSGCFYPQVTNKNKDPSCSNYYWGSKSDFNDYAGTYSSYNLTCLECRTEFRHYAILVVVSQTAVLVSFVLTWNIVLRYILFLRAEKLRQRSLAPRVSYFNEGMPRADVIPENPSRPQNAPPLYTEKAQTLDVNNLSVTEQREARTNSLPPYEETPVMVTSPASNANDSVYGNVDSENHSTVYSMAPSVISDNSQSHLPPNTNPQQQPARPVTVDDLL